jgi:PAS domain S-box-containing protein
MSDNKVLLEEKIKRLEAQLEAAKADRTMYKKLFEVSADAHSIIDLSTGKFVKCNQAAIDMHGVENEANFLNLKPSDLSPERQPCGGSSEILAKVYIENAFSQGPQLFQWTHSRLDGTTFPCLVSLSAIALEGRELVLAIGRDITELMEAQADLEAAVADRQHYQSAYEEEREKFEQFVNLAPVGIAINKMSTGEFEYVNQEFGRFTGYEIDELNQMDYWQLTPKKYEEQEQVQLQSLSETGRYGPYKKDYIHKNGQTYPVQLSGLKIARRSGEEFIWSVVQDISERSKVEEQMQAAKEEAELSAFRMKLANDSAGIGVWEWDLINNSLIWDHWMYTLYGITENMFSGAYEAWENSVHPDDIEMARKSLNEAIEGTGVYEPEFRVVHPNGNIRTMKASAEVIRDEKGNALRVIGVNYDVTDKIEAIEKLSAAKQEAEDANHSKNAFLANMSHEIRTPMNAILGGLQILRSEKLDQELRVILENASSSAKSLLTIINDILDYSKIAENKLDLELQPFSIIHVLESVKFDLDNLVSTKGIVFENVIDEYFDDGWIGDVVRVKQILLNLVSNAVKFTERGKVKVDLSCQDYHGKNAICINVIDTGIGMSEEVQSRIFERFEQADSSTTRKFGGTGLGMAITINLIKMMNGSINLRSVLNKGTTIQVILPLEQTDDFSQEEIQKAVSPPNLQAKRILIAEDNEINQIIVQTMLRKTGASLVVVENGKLAVEAVQRTDFDLVLMDIQMPEMDGVEAKQRISVYNSDLPVIALTANAMVNDVKRYLALGFVAHIAKPIEMNDLYSRLAEYLE